MKYVANVRMESIFAQAAALQQNGRLRNIVYGYNKYIYIMNQDRTLLLRFPLTRSNEVSFKEPISFHANDYVANTFFFKDGHIHFVSENKKYRSVHKCKAPEHSPKDIHEYFIKKRKEIPLKNRIDFSEEMLPLIRNELTHLEIQAKGGKVRFLQRDIYAGSKVIITPLSQEGKGLLDLNDFEDFGPVGIRTNDFLALFSFTNSVSFFFSNENVIGIKNNDRKLEYTGILSLCRYNELKG